MVARTRSTFGKRDRERANQLKAQAKRDRRQLRSTDRAAGESEAEPDTSAVDQQELLNRLAALQTRFESHEVSLEEFEAQREELRSQIRV